MKVYWSRTKGADGNVEGGIEYLEEMPISHWSNGNVEGGIEYLEEMGLIGNDYHPNQIIFNGITTVCIFHDGTKVISRPQKGEKFDRETGVAMCIAKYIYGSRSKFLRAVESGYEQEAK